MKSQETPLLSTNELLPIYFSKAYQTCQDHKHLIRFENDYYMIDFSIENNMATSVPKSPFGSVFQKKDSPEKEFKKFIQTFEKNLKERGVNSLNIKCAPTIYDSFVSANDYLNAGYQILFEDENQHINLDENWVRTIHPMQQRKLNSLNTKGFQFEKLSEKQLETAHQFIAACRLNQGLEINISYNLLKQLQTETNAYDVFVVHRERKFSAVCICVRVSSNTAYYYLPATSPMFRSESPMVLLIAGMVDYYTSLSYKYFDLGVSSINGKPQDTLKLFKERMGGITTKKPFFTKKLI